MADITVIEAGYGGLVTGACLARLGHSAGCLALDERRIHQHVQHAGVVAG